MADYPRDLDSAQQLRRLQEQVRRLQTRVIPDPNSSSYKVLQTDLYSTAAAGWALDGFPFPCFVRTGNVVQVSGSFVWQGSAALAGVPYPYSSLNIIRPDKIPAEFRPVTIRRLLGQNDQAGQIYVWSLRLFPSGVLTLANYHDGVTAPYPNGQLPADITGAPYTSVGIEASYCISEPGDT